MGGLFNQWGIIMLLELMQQTKQLGIITGSNSLQHFSKAEILSSCNKAIELGITDHVLIVSSLPMIRYVWQPQAGSFIHGRDKADIARNPTTIKYMNFDGFGWLARNSPMINKNTTLIIDHSLILRNATAKRAQSIQRVITMFDRRYTLSSHLCDLPLDIFSQALLIDDGDSLGSNFYAFRHRYFVETNGRKFDTTWKLKEGALNVILRKTNHLFHRAGDVLPRSNDSIKSQTISLIKTRL